MNYWDKRYNEHYHIEREMYLRLVQYKII